MPPHEMLREALGQVVSDLRREWRRERELIEAQAGQVVADLRSKVIELEQVIRGMVEAKLAQIKDGEPGQSVTLEDMAPLVSEAVELAVSKMPAAKDGSPGNDGDPGKDADPELVRALVEEAVAALPAPKDGQSVTVEDCLPAIQEAVAALPKPQDGKSVTIKECMPAIEEALQRAVAALPAPKDGKDGKLPVVKAWSDKVHYESDVVAHAGSTFQALRDTAKAPPHEDWICIARGGADGRSFTVRGTYEATGEYHELDVVALNGAAFVAKRATPGDCPGEGWQMIAMQGRQGKPSTAKGDPGPPGPRVQSMSVDDDGMLTVRNADGSTATCDLYPLLSRLGN